MSAPDDPRAWASDLAGVADREPVGALLARLRAVILAETDALGADDFDALERLATERAEALAALDGYTPADLQSADRALLEQVQALDQRLIATARDGLERTGQELREIRRGRGVVNEYQRRGQTLIRNLGQLNLEG